MDIALRITAIMAMAYFIGGIPFALVVSRLVYKTDVRNHGSGNTGATNVVRVCGWRAGLSVLLLDILKGAFAVWVALLLTPDNVSVEVTDWMLIVAAMAAVLGHSYSPYIGFKGGKGVATAAGGLLLITPEAWVVMLVTFLLLVGIWRMVSLGSIALSIEFPLLCVLLYPDRTPVVIMAFLAGALVFWRHKSNLGRIIRGEESKLEFKRGGIRRSAEKELLSRAEGCADTDEKEEGGS